MIGTNYKLSNIQAAIGLVQMRHIEELLTKRKEISERYYRLLADMPTIAFPGATENGTHAWQSCCIFIENRNQVIELLKEKKIETQIGTYSLHMHKAFNDNSHCHIMGGMQGSRYAFEHCLTLPVYHDITDEEQVYVARQLLEITAR